MSLESVARRKLDIGMTKTQAIKCKTDNFLEVTLMALSPFEKQRRRTGGQTQSRI